MEIEEKIKKNRDDRLKQTKEHYQKLAFKPKTSVTIAELDAETGYNMVYEERKKIEDKKAFGTESLKKVADYDKYVRQMYRPTVSVKKQLEMEHVKASLKH